MPIIRRVIVAASEDALTTLKFKTQSLPALVSLFASSATAGEDLSFSVDSQEFALAAEINLESGNQIIDMERDAILFNERVPAGEYFLRVPVVAVDMSFALVIDPVEIEEEI